VGADLDCEPLRGRLFDERIGPEINHRRYVRFGLPLGRVVALCPANTRPLYDGSSPASATVVHMLSWHRHGDQRPDDDQKLLTAGELEDQDDGMAETVGFELSAVL
jgi:hypothetical protein